MFKFCSCVVSILCASFFSLSTYADYSTHPDAVKVIQELVDEEGLDPAVIKKVLASAEKRQSIIDAMNRPAERTMTWGRYRNIFMKDARIDGGAEFYRTHADTLRQAEAEFGVPAEVIVAIIGVETLYGGNTGSYPVIDALTTLAFDYPKRAPFFRSELKHFLILTSEQGKDPLLFKGSYAGAMGLGQFMPSSYRAYARSYDDDGFIDIWEDEADAIWSVANYLKAHGWKANKPIARRVAISEDFDSSAVSDDLKPDLSIEQLSAAGVVMPVSSSLSAFDSEEALGEIATLMALNKAQEASDSESEDAQSMEYWIGWQNFYVVTRYNHSHLYAMAVFQLSEAIADRL